MKKIIFVLLGVAIGFFVCKEAKADIALRTQTTYNFLQAGQPYNQPINFQVQCYGTRVNFFDEDQEKKLEKIIDLTGDCTNYGCKFEHNLFGYHADIQYCDMEGETKGKKFTVKNFAGDNLKNLQCQNVTEQVFDIAKSDGYFKRTPEYNKCIDDVRKEYYLDDGSYLCHKYLEEVTDGQAGIIINDKKYKSTDKSNACIAENDSKEQTCDKYLQDVSEKVKKEGYGFDQTCEIKVDLPKMVDGGDLDKSDKLVKNFWGDFFNSLKCWLLKLMGQKCS